MQLQKLVLDNINAKWLEKLVERLHKDNLAKYLGTFTIHMFNPSFFSIDSLNMC